MPALFLAAALIGISASYVVFEILPARQAAAAQADFRLYAENAVRGALKDPGSAQFGSFQQKGTAACGTVNAKNAFGGYVGMRRYVVLHGSVTLEESALFDSYWTRFCR